MLPLAIIDKKIGSPLTKEDRGLDYGAQVSDSLVFGETFGIVFRSRLKRAALLFVASHDRFGPTADEPLLSWLTDRRIEIDVSPPIREAPPIAAIVHQPPMNGQSFLERGSTAS